MNKKLNIIKQGLFQQPRGQLFFIGVIGQYLARVFEELKNRPIYILKQVPSKSQDQKYEIIQKNRVLEKITK